MSDAEDDPLAVCVGVAVGVPVGGAVPLLLPVLLGDAPKVSDGVGGGVVVGVADGVGLGSGTGLELPKPLTDALVGAAALGALEGVLAGVALPVGVPLPVLDALDPADIEEVGDCVGDVVSVPVEVSDGRGEGVDAGDATCRDDKEGGAVTEGEGVGAPVPDALREARGESVAGAEGNEGRVGETGALPVADNENKGEDNVDGVPPGAGAAAPAGCAAAAGTKSAGIMAASSAGMKAAGYMVQSSRKGGGCAWCKAITMRSTSHWYENSESYESRSKV